MISGPSLARSGLPPRGLTVPRSIRGLASAALLLPLAAGCGRDDSAPSPDPAATPSAGGTAILAEAADMGLPTPLTAASVLDGGLAEVFYMGLTRAAWRDGRLIHLTADSSAMALARSFEIGGADSTVLRYRMRPDVRWSDGVTVTAADVVFTYDLARDSTLRFTQANYVAQIDSVVAEDDTTVAFHFARRYPDMLTHSAIGVLPRHRFSGVSGSEFRQDSALLDPSGGRLVVSGPFLVQRWARGQQIVLEPNPHFRPRPHLERIVIRVVPDPVTRLVEFETGAVHYASSVPPDRAEEIQARVGGARIEKERGRYYDFIAYNPERFPPFADPSLRRALSQALDTRGILRALGLTAHAEPAGGPYSPVFRDLYDSGRMGPPPYDPAAAREALAALGWRDSDGDAILDKGGRPLKFRMETNTGSQRRADLAQIAQDQWRQVGVDVELQQTEFQTLMQGVIGGDYEAVLFGWGVGLSPDITGMWREGAPLNLARYRSESADSLFELALGQSDAVAAAPYWRQAAARVAADQPFTWLFYHDNIHLVSDRLRGMRIDTYGAYQNPWEWWVE